MAGKRHRNNLKDTDSNLNYLLNDAINKIKDLKSANFDETVDLAINLGVDPKHADQLVRGTVSLPNGTGKNVKVVVMTKDPDKVKEASASGADYYGFEEYFDKIKGVGLILTF